MAGRVSGGPKPSRTMSWAFSTTSTTLRAGRSNPWQHLCDGRYQSVLCGLFDEAETIIRSLASDLNDLNANADVLSATSKSITNLDLAIPSQAMK